MTVRPALEGERGKDRTAGGTAGVGRRQKGVRGGSTRYGVEQEERATGEPRERMCRFRYRPAAGRVSRARSLSLSYSWLRGPLASRSRMYIRARGRIFRLSRCLSLSLSLPSIPSPRAARRADFSRSLVPSSLSLLPLRLSPANAPCGGAAALAPCSPAPSLFFSLIRSRRSRLPSSSRRSESNRL